LIAYRPRGLPHQYSRPVDFYAGRVHFLDHLASIWNALPSDRRGTFWVRPDRGMLGHAERRGVAVRATERPAASPPGDGPIVVAAYSDLDRAAARQRPLILMEHGVGLSFPEHSPGYAGGRGLRSWVSLFLAPNQDIATKTARTFPEAAQAVIGTPKLDSWHARSLKPRSDPPVVAISFHWQCGLCPEAGNAWEHMKSGIPALAKAFPLIGHGHPKILDELAPQYEAMGVEVVRDYEEVSDRADIYVNDASSTLYEFASLDRPVVVMNAPWFRRDVYYGIRWWDYSDVGVECNEPEDLVRAVELALRDTPEQQAKRHAATDALYPIHDGTAGQRAAEAILEHCQRRTGEGRMTFSELRRLARERRA
jgi:hypothetical protein